MSSLQVLEDRIAALERKIYGQNKPEKINYNDNSVIDNILHANMLISTALKGREKSNMLTKRLTELNEYMGKNLDDSDLLSETKLQILLSVETEMKERLELFSQINGLINVLDTDQFKDVPELSHKLHDLTLTYLTASEEAETFNKKALEMNSKYEAIITEVSGALSNIEEQILAAESAAKAK